MRPTTGLTAAAAVPDGAIRQRIVDALTHGGIEVVAADPSALPDVLVATSDLEDARESALSAVPLVLVVSGANRSTARSALMAGAAGVVVASQLDDALCPTVRAVHAGQQVLPREARRRAAPLSYREREVLTFVVSGLTNQEVGARLCLSESTVKTHLTAVFRKLGIHSRAEAIALALDPKQAAVLGLPVQWNGGSNTAESSIEMPELQAGRN